MSFNWQDLQANSLQSLKEQCHTLNLSIPDRSSKREILRILQDYQNQMDLNQVKPSPLSETSSSKKIHQSSPLHHTQMTPISTIKPNYISSDTDSSRHHSRKPKHDISSRSPTPVVFHQSQNSFFECNVKNVIILILLILFICLIPMIL